MAKIKSNTAQPLWHTPRDESRPTLGPVITEIAQALGYAPMEWQRRLWDTALELDDDGALRYREVRVSVPRQSGKSTSLLPVLVDRLTNNEKRQWGSRPQAAFAAQGGDAARAMLIDTWLPVIEDSPYFDNVGTVVRSNGRESVKLGKGTALVMRNSPSAGHGKVIDLGMYDECFAARDARIEQALRPAMITRTSPQFWMTSTAGSAESTYWWSKVEDGRARCENNDHGPVCFVEYGLPEGVDLFDCSRYPSWHPAVGLTIRPEALAAEIATMDKDEALRAYGNRWTKAVQRIIPEAAWSACTAPDAQMVGSCPSRPGRGSWEPYSLDFGRWNDPGRPPHGRSDRFSGGNGLDRRSAGRSGGSAHRLERHAGRHRCRPLPPAGHRGEAGPVDGEAGHRQGRHVGL